MDPERTPADLKPEEIEILLAYAASLEEPICFSKEFTAKLNEKQRKLVVDVLSKYETEGANFAGWPEKMLVASFFIRTLAAAEIHWFFVQGYEACLAGRIFPGVLSLITGVEASIRRTCAQIDKVPFERTANFSNKLLRDVRSLGFPVEMLAFPAEQDDFAARIRDNNHPVEIVRIRNLLHHGNAEEWSQTVDDIEFLTPECLRPIVGPLITASMKWAAALGQFRREKLK